MSSTPTWNQLAVQHLTGVRAQLISFTRQALLEGHFPNLEDLQPVILPLAFDDEMWRSSALFQPLPTGLEASIRDHEILNSLMKWTFDQYFPRLDESAHQGRVRIGADWALMSLSCPRCRP